MINKNKACFYNDQIEGMKICFGLFSFTVILIPF